MANLKSGFLCTAVLVVASFFGARSSLYAQVNQRGTITIPIGGPSNRHSTPRITTATSSPFAQPSLSPISEPECGSEVRLDQIGGQSITFRDFNQGSLGTCYAYAATMMADWWQARSQIEAGGEWNPAHAQAPLIAAIETQARLGNSDFTQGGQTCEVFQTLAATGGCRDSAIFSNGGAQIADNLLQYREQYLQGTEGIRAWQGSYRDQQVERLAAGACRNLDQATLLPEDILPSVSEMTSHLAEPHEVAYLNAIFSGACARDENRVPALNGSGARHSCGGYSPRSARAGSVPVGTSRMILDHFQMGSDAGPVSLTVCADLVRTGTRSRTGTCQSEQHAIVVLGKRWNSARAQCEVLVRNSWGQDGAELGPLRTERAPGVGGWMPLDRVGEFTTDILVTNRRVGAP